MLFEPEDLPPRVVIIQIEERSHCFHCEVKAITAIDGRHANSIAGTAAGAEKNPNVFYEVGIAHTLNKDVLLLSQSIADVPFDLRHQRVLIYDYTPRGKQLEDSIVKNVNSIVGKGA